MSWSWFHHFHSTHKCKEQELDLTYAWLWCVCEHKWAICIGMWLSGLTSANCIGQVSHVETTLSWGKLREKESDWDLVSCITWRGKFLAHTGVRVCLCVRETRQNTRFVLILIPTIGPTIHSNKLSGLRAMRDLQPFHFNCFKSEQIKPKR